MSSCVIVEVSRSDDWIPRHGCKAIPDDKRPTILHPGRDVAEAEALRLARMHPGRRFVVFEAAAAGITVNVPTHVTLGGAVIMEHGAAHLAQIDEDEVPF